MAGRILGFTGSTRPSKEQLKVVLQNLRDAETNESLDTQDENGLCDNMYAMRNTRTISADGETEPTQDGGIPELPKVGRKMTLGTAPGVDFLIRSCEKTAAAGQALKFAITLERKDDATIHDYDEVHPPASGS